jgi:Trypsin-co-occurring domain 1
MAERMGFLNGWGRHVKRHVEVVEIEFPDGEIGYAEVELDVTGDVGERRRFRFDQVNGQIRRMTRWLLTEVRDAVPDTPDKIGVEFGFKFSAKTGKLIGALAEAGGEASVVVKLEWTPGAEKSA